MTTTIEAPRLALSPAEVQEIRAITDKNARANKAAAVVRAMMEWPDDLVDVAQLAARIARETKDLGDKARHRRDIAGLVMIEPFQAVQRPYDTAMEKIDAALEAGRIDAAEAHKRREKARTKRREGMEGVEYKPIHVYRDTIGVSRGLFVRMQHRAAQELPAFLDDDGQPLPLAEVKEIALEARAECEMYDAINLGARTIRDEVGHVLLNGDRKAGVRAMSNADFARLTKVTTARVAQIRYGIR
jgi:hypothetical protein